MFGSMSLACKIQLALCVIGLSLLISTVSYFYNDEKELAEQFAKVNLESSAQNYFDSVNTMMLTGTMANRKLIQDKLLQQPGIVEARIIRGDKVTGLFGPGFEDQKAMDALDRRGLSGDKSFQLVTENGKRQLQFVMPMKASADYRGTNCLACHQAQEGDILGVVRMTYDLSLVDKRIHNSLIKVGLMQVVLILIGFGVLSLIIRKLVINRLRDVGNTMREVEQNLDLNQRIKVNYNDEIGEVSAALNRMMDKFLVSFTTVSDVTGKLISSAKQVDNISELTKGAVLSQKSATVSVAAAINELDASASDVENNTQIAAEKSVSADEKASQGLALARETREGIDALRDKVEQNAQMITQLNCKTEEVGSVLDVINSIADQTNLLALNAAIEAARAGEQGRGFAVVADEVRTLAVRTHDSIGLIQQTIKGLQTDTSNAVQSMNEVSRQAQEKAGDVAKVSDLISDLSQQFKELDELNSQVAEAAKQQNIAAEEINKNVVHISDIAEQSSDDAIRGKQVSEQLLELSFELDQQVKLFKVVKSEK